MQPPLLERVFFRDQHAEGLAIAGPAAAARLNYRNLLLADNDDDRLLQSNHKHLPSIVWSGQVCPAMVDSKLIEGNYQPILSTPPYRNICGPTKTYGRVNGSFVISIWRGLVPERGRSRSERNPFLFIGA